MSSSLPPCPSWCTFHDLDPAVFPGDDAGITHVAPVALVEVLDDAPVAVTVEELELAATGERFGVRICIAGWGSLAADRARCLAGALLEAADLADGGDAGRPARRDGRTRSARRSSPT